MREISIKEGRKLARRKVRDWFPSILPKQFKVTSLPGLYNCHASALGFDDRWATHEAGYYWPKAVPAGPQLDRYIAMFEFHGFVPCSDGSFEAGATKVVLYGSKDYVLHSARLYSPDIWHSKLGDAWDILHELQAIDRGMYGAVLCFMRKSNMLPLAPKSTSNIPSSSDPQQ